MKRIGITEFDGRIAEVWEGEPIAIERNGPLIGYYIPVGWNRALDREAALDEAFARFEAALARARGKRHDRRRVCRLLRSLEASAPSRASTIRRLRRSAINGAPWPFPCSPHHCSCSRRTRASTWMRC